MPKDERRKRQAPSRTLEGSESQMVALATELAKKQLIEGTASATVISHFLKLGTTRERLEQRKLETEVTLLEARREQLASIARTEELFAAAMKAMKSYSSGEDDEDDEDEYIERR